MARMRAADYGEKQQLIRDKAAALFAERGFATTSIADIAAACGTAKSLVYHYFGAKDEILYDLLRDHMARLVAGAEAALATAADPRERLREFVRDVFDGQAESLVLRLVEDESLTRAELREIERKIAEAEKAGPTKKEKK